MVWRGSRSLRSERDRNNFREFKAWPSTTEGACHRAAHGSPGMTEMVRLMLPSSGRVARRKLLLQRLRLAQRGFLEPTRANDPPAIAARAPELAINSSFAAQENQPDNPLRGLVHAAMLAITSLNAG